MLGLAVEGGEIAASAAGDENLFPRLFGALDDGHAPAAFAGLDRAQQAGGTGAENQDVKVVGRHVAKKASDSIRMP